jgi:uncharacterized protein (TIGR02145 family)
MKKLAIIIYLMLTISIVYSQTVKIGKQVWMKHNLDVDRFRNGDLIPEAKSKEEWEKAGLNEKPAWCYYDNDTEKGRVYGKLYNYYAVNDLRGLAPEGFHIPNYNEWDELLIYIGGMHLKSSNLDERYKAICLVGKKLQSINGWKTNNGTDEIGFSGLPGGIRGYDLNRRNGVFSGIGEIGLWWCLSSDEVTVISAGTFEINSYHNDSVDHGSANRVVGISVRCIKD